MCATPRTRYGARKPRFSIGRDLRPFARRMRGGNKPLCLDHPKIEGFTVIQEVKAKDLSNVAAV